MLKKIISYFLTVIMLASMISTSALAATRTAATGAAFTVASEGESVMYLWENVKSNDIASSKLTIGDGDTSRTDTIDANGYDEATGYLYTNSGSCSWEYTVNISKDGWYRLDMLGSSGWVSAGGSADAGGRVNIAFTGDNSVSLDTSKAVMHSWGGGLSLDQMVAYETYTELDTAEIKAGTYTMTLTANSVHSNGNMMFKRLKFTPVDVVEPLVGEPITVSDSAETSFYAAGNVNIDDKADLKFKDINWGDDVDKGTIETRLIGATENNISWSYNLAVAKTGLYKVAVLGWSGWSDAAATTDGGGRFEMTFDYNGLIDGVGVSEVILPPWGNGSATESAVPSWNEFGDADRVVLGTVGLSKGSHTLSLNAVNAASGNMLFKKIYFIPVADEELTYIKIDARKYDETNMVASEENNTGVINNTTYCGSASGATAVRGPSAWTPKDASSNPWYMDYSFNVEEAGKYWVGVRSAINRGTDYGVPHWDTPTVSVSIYDNADTLLGTGTYKSPYCGSSESDESGLLPRSSAGLYDLQAGSYKIRIHGASYSTYFQAIELWPLSVGHLVNGLNKTSFSALEVSPQGGLYTIDYYNGATSGDKYVKLPAARIDDVYEKDVYWDIYVAEGDEGWYDMWFNAATPSDTTEKNWWICVDGTVKDWLYGNAAVITPGTVLPETKKVSMYLTEGFHTVGFYPSGNTGGRDIHIQTVNIQAKGTVKVHDVSAEGTTRIMAYDYSDKSHNRPIVTSLINKLDGAKGLYCRASNNAKQSITFEVDVAEGGWYTPSLGICGYDYTKDNKTYTWKVTVNDAENPVTVKAAPDTDYIPTKDADGNPLAKQYPANGNIYLPAGIQTITAYTQNGNALNTYLHYLELVKTTGETPIDVSGTTEISALDYDGVFGGITSIDWRENGNPALNLKFTSGTVWFYKTGAVYQINVTEAGTYNIGIKAVQPPGKASSTAQLLYAEVDGIDAGYVTPTASDDKNIELTPLWVRPVKLSAGVHEITIYGVNHYPIYLETVVLEKAETTYNETPKSVVYNRAAGATAGFADGTITVTHSANTKVGAYHFYWGDASGKLADYTAFGFQPVSDTSSASLTYTIKSGLMIPEGATRILAYPAKIVEGNPIESASYAAADLPDGSVLELNRDEKLFSFWINSDTHYAQPDYVREHDNLIANKDMLAVDQNVLGLITTGDVTNNGILSDWLSAKKVYDATFGEVNLPWYILPGNHDTGREKDYDSAQDYYTKYANEFSNGVNDNSYYYFKKDDAYFVFLADETHGINYGLTQTQLDWVENILKMADAEKAPVFMFNHYPLSFIKTDLGNKFVEMVQSRKNIVYFYGHQHFPQAYYNGATIGGSDGINEFGSASTVKGYGPETNKHKIDENNTVYCNSYTNYIEGHLVDVYSGYVVVRGRSHSTQEWEGFDNFLIKTNYSPVSISRNGEKLTLKKNPNYTEPFDAYIAEYGIGELANAQKITAAELSENAKEIILTEETNRKVKVFVWDNGLKPLRKPIEY